jgi:hypothetical protein
VQEAWAVIEEVAARLSYGEQVTCDDIMQYDQAMMLIERSNDDD